QVPERHRTGSRRVVPFQAFETKNGPMIIAAGNDRLFAKLAEALGHPEWAKDPRFATNAARVTHRDELMAAIEPVVATRTKGERTDALEAAGVPCGPIHPLPEAVATEQAAALGIAQRVPGDDYELIGLPLSFDGERPPLRVAPPVMPGQHNREILG